MKLRIQGNSVRLRLKREEVDALHDTGLVRETLELGPPPDIPFHQTLGTHAGGGVELRHREGGLTVVIPAEWAEEMALNDRTGYDIEVLTGGGVLVQVLIECDLPCEHPRKDAGTSAAPSESS